MIGQKCRIDGCNKIIHARGTLCPTHRTRWQMRGTFEPSQKALNRFQPVLTRGYYRININGKRVFQHDYAMEQFIGRKLEPFECVHHLNGIKSDNRIENLKLITKSKHATHHSSYKKMGWSRHFKECVKCHSTRKPHNARGLCERCYGYEFKWHIKLNNNRFWKTH